MIEQRFKKATIGVLFGGDSAEREISCRSGNAVFAALQASGYRARAIKIASCNDLVPGLRGIDIAFIALHGGSGENGEVQRLLDVMDIPYTGSPAQAHALAIDKVRTKAIFHAAGIPTPRYCVYTNGDLECWSEMIITELNLPIVLKPHDQGSSIGVKLVERADEIRIAATDILREFGSLFAEEQIIGRELTVGILSLAGKDTALPVLEIHPKNKFYSYDAKYTPGKAEFLIPAPLPSPLTEYVQRVSLKAHNILGCSGFSRIDLRLAEDGTPYVLEVNTIPGMTHRSNLPQAALAAGIDYIQLVEMMLATANSQELGISI
ncbi:D-alanine--D-alanine ligase [Candidatus Acetothermia bacterium]|nr:D-alanine--D-alanine ligase [Candidatus Acetothermia bacterium]